MNDFREGASPAEGEVRKQIMPIKEVLIRARADTNRAVPDELRQVNVSPLLSHMRQLRERTATAHREHAKIVYVDPDQRLLVSNNPIVGSELEVADLHDHIPPARLQQYVLDMHTHISDSPLSPTDLAGLFYPTSLTRGESIGGIVLADSQTTMITRGPRTPQWQPSQIEQQLAEWEQEAMSRLREALVEALPAHVTRNVRTPQDALALANSPMAQFVLINAGAGYLRELVRKHDLRWFNGSPDAQVLTLQTA